MKSKKKKKKSALLPFILKNKLIAYILLLVLIPSALYIRIIHFEFSQLDDIQIVNNINNAEGTTFNVKEAFAHDAFFGIKGDTFYRPIQTISFMLDAAIGGREPWIFHLSNLIWHILTVIALFIFLKKTGVKEEISFLISLLFSINPLFANAVAWVPARGDILLCLFSLLSFITFLEYLDKKKKLYIIIHSIAFFLAMFSKETAVLIPILILSYNYFIQKEKIVFNEYIPFFSIWVLTFIIFFLLRLSVIKITHTANVFGIIPFIKNLPVIPITLFKFFFPYNLTTMPFFDNFGIIGGCILFLVFAGLIFKFIQNVRNLAVWGVVWFLAFSIPPMFFRTYFAAIGYEYFEYRTYLPIVGILLISGLLISELTADVEFKKVLIFAIPLLLVYSAFAFIHMGDFADPFSFFNSAIKVNSKNAMAFGERGNAYYYKKNMEKAMLDFDNSIKVCPTYPVPYFNKGLIYSASNDHYKAEYFLSLALKYDTVSQDINLLKGETYGNLSLTKIALKKFDEAEVILKKAMRIYPQDYKLHNNLGLTYYNETKFDFALKEYNKAIESDKNDYAFFDNRGMTKYHLNDFMGALYDFNKVLELKPDFLDTWGSRGMTKIKLNDYDGAISDLTRVINTSKDNVGAAHYYRGIAYMKLARIKEAKDDWERAAESGYLKAVEMLNQYKAL